VLRVYSKTQFDHVDRAWHALTARVLPLLRYKDSTHVKENLLSLVDSLYQKNISNLCQLLDRMLNNLGWAAPGDSIL